MQPLEQYIRGYFGITTHDVTGIIQCFEPVTVRKGDYFLKAGRYSDRLGFVQQGLVREFVAVGDKEVTKWICSPGYFAVDLASFMFGGLATSSFQALTDAELMVLGREAYQQLPQLVPGWPDLEKRFLGRCFTILEQRVVSLLSLTAEERYQQLFAHNSDLFNTVPLQYLASMLGMTPETLSRLRNRNRTHS
ncbi:MAG: Crp/Fnr family transcriptional regulator [Chitinophagia bacterium]|nr:Crp/Fnr family transcriptional regulator [Chitinophagia bacterium]